MSVCFCQFLLMFSSLCWWPALLPIFQQQVNCTGGHSVWSGVPPGATGTRYFEYASLWIQAKIFEYFHFFISAVEKVASLFKVLSNRQYALFFQLLMGVTLWWCLWLSLSIKTPFLFECWTVSWGAKYLCTQTPYVQWTSAKFVHWCACWIWDNWAYYCYACDYVCQIIYNTNLVVISLKQINLTDTSSCLHYFLLKQTNVMFFKILNINLLCIYIVSQDRQSRFSVVGDYLSLSLIF